jgi:hypothetical protein
VAAGGERADQAAVVGGRAVPVGSRAGSIRRRRSSWRVALQGRFGGPTPSAARIASSSSTRWAQVWRARMRARGRRWRARPRARGRARRAGGGASRRRAGDEVVACRAEQALGVVPGRRDQRDAAGERLEDADRRDARQRRDVGPARHVHGDAVAREGGGHLPVGQPAAVGDAGRSRAPRARRRVAHAEDARREAERADGLDRNSCELPRARRRPSCRSRRGRPRRAARGAGWKRRTSAASCHVHARAQPLAR